MARTKHFGKEIARFKTPATGAQQGWVETEKTIIVTDTASQFLTNYLFKATNGPAWTKHFSRVVAT